VTAPAIPTAPVQPPPARLHRAMGFRDLLLFYLVTGFTVRWIGAAASAGPSAVVVWLGACLLFYVPLMLTVLELSSRYPHEGGCYVWSTRAFGDFAGFMTGWNYRVCNLPYFPGLFYFTAASALFIGGASWQGLTDSPAYYVTFSLIALAVAVTLNVRADPGGGRAEQGARGHQGGGAHRAAPPGRGGCVCHGEAQAAMIFRLWPQLASVALL